MNFNVQIPLVFARDPDTNYYFALFFLVDPLQLFDQDRASAKQLPGQFRIQIN